MWQSDSSFRALLRADVTAVKVENVVPALEFAVSCTVVKYIFWCSRRTYILVPGGTRFSKIGSLPLARTVETRAT